MAMAMAMAMGYTQTDHRAAYSKEKPDLEFI
jgi:hypothetical protein